MRRFKRPDFDPAELKRLGPERATQLIFDWWRDDTDREAWFDHLNGALYWIASRAPIQDDPAPPRSQPAPQGHARVALISDPGNVRHALSSSADYSNIPYAELGGAGFMLAIDPAPPNRPPDWHARQRALAVQALGAYQPAQLAVAAQWAVRQAALLSLRAAHFDLAEFAEQAALRYLGLLFGYSERDHPLLEDAARCGYRGLQYVIVGRHFVSEPGTLPAAQQALARLATRTSALIDEYALRRRSPRWPRPPATVDAARKWPEGVQPWCELGLSGLGEPLLHGLPALAGELNGNDLCNIVGGLLVGAVGNVQTALCLMVASLIGTSEADALRQKKEACGLVSNVERLLARHPPVPFLPRRTRGRVPVKGGTVPADTDCIVVLRAAQNAGCPHAWGNDGNAPLTHGCIGRALIVPLLAELLHHTLRLPGLDVTLDPLTGEELKPERLWGMGCLRYPLRYDREKRLVQQPLIVVMPLKSPHAEHAERLRRVIRAGAPRIQWALDDSRHIHMAWFELSDDETALTLRTVYDGDFDAYIQHFALKVGDLFDQLFASIDVALPLPVVENPDAFVETIRRYNRAPLGGYFYSAYPNTDVAQITRHPGVAP
ncbi:MAG: hypothetical protein JSR75_12010 [Proteobacteria bacterium]|nr:hypothetical protein [Pseudomonadota bacterium]